MAGIIPNLDILFREEWMFGPMAKGAEAEATLYRSNVGHKGPFNASGQPDGARWPGKLYLRVIYPMWLEHDSGECRAMELHMARRS